MTQRIYWGPLNGETLVSAMAQKMSTGRIKASVRHTVEGKSVMMIVLEFYYFRIASDVSISLLITPYEDQTQITAISAAGTSGLFQFTFGSEQAAMKALDRILLNIGFKPQLVEKN